MSSARQTDPSQVHVKVDETSTAVPTISGLVTTYSVSPNHNPGSNGWINTAFTTFDDEGADAFIKAAPFKSLPNGNSQTYTISQGNVGQSGNDDPAVIKNKCSCCKKRKVKIGLLVGGVILLCAAIAGLVVGLVLGLSKGQNETPSVASEKTLYLAGTLRVNISWTSDLGDQSTSMYDLTSSQILEQLTLVMENSSLWDAYLLHPVINFRRGSVLAKFRLDVNVTTETPHDVLIILQNGFQELIDISFIPIWYLDPKSDIWIEECGQSEFWCSDGTCLLREFVCDKINDCGDYSDETNCLCLKTDFQCKTGMCIDGWKHCDNKSNCPDKSDEVNCICPMGQFHCTNGTCIMAEWVCDREKDCPNGEDESNCGNCSSSQFQCRDYSCVSTDSQCNGIYDCPDVSDEDHCISQGSDLVIKGLSNSVWLPFCSAGITNETYDLMCLALGMNGVISSSSVMYTSETYLMYNIDEPYNITNFYHLMAAFHPGANCPNNSALVLQCGARDCGVSTVENMPSGLIVNGNDAASGKWPWQVAIYSGFSFICGGSLLDQYHVITAAHCVSILDASYLVMVGSNRRSPSDPNQQFKSVKLIEIHPKYTDYGSGYDIAILTLKTPVNYTDFVRPICLAEPEDELPLTSICYSSGWGRTDYNNTDYAPEILQQAKMQLWSFEECQLTYPFLIPLMQCAGYASGYIANCLGDSGGPLVCYDPRGFWKLVGVFSFLFRGCNVPMKPSVFTNVPEFFSWIEDKLTCKFYCDNGMCIWDLRSLCDGINDCGDLTDEYKTCNFSISCNFEDSYKCGYRNAEGPQLGSWIRKSGAAGINEGPIVDSTYGNNSGHYMYSSAARSILLAPIYNQMTTHCLQFRLNVRAQNCGGFRAFIQPTTMLNLPPGNVSLDDNRTILYEWRTGFCNLDLWQTVRENITAGTFILGFEAYADAANGLTSTSMAFDDVQLLNGACTSQVCDAETEFTCVDDNVCIPASGHCNYYIDCIDVSDEPNNCPGKSYSCDFERYGSCGFEQSVLDKADWLLSSAAEAALDAGCPKLDHTTNTPQGNILYISTLYGNAGDLALISLPIKTSSRPGCFSMYFSMVSRGRLNVVYKFSSQSVTVFSIDRVNISNWQLLQLVLPVGPYAITIEGLNGVEFTGTTTGYIAIDDMKITEANCTRPECTNHEFACLDGLCIYHERVCNGIDDCRDGSDETPEVCVCRPESYFCASGECLQGHVRCDGIENCRDGSDELNCETCNFTVEYKCVSDGRCKLRSTWCDGTIDCFDGSDELPNCTCLAEQFRCQNGHCILAVEYCNGIIDCADGSDEGLGCSCSLAGLISCDNGTCATPCNLVQECKDGRNDEANCTQFKCLDGSVISPSQRCDGLVDCSYAEDEQNCVCGATDFRCTAGKCISGSKVCDGFYDCPDLSDERNCTCTKSQFRCDNGLCLPSYVHCNDVNDCLDFSDERNCTCGANMFHCTNGICLPSVYRCNYNDDCGDQSDEVNCTCKPQEIRCSDGRCIQQQWICDGSRDCKDGSDEFNCSNCDNSTQFTCRKDYTCIPLLWRCDGKNDCQDGSDELSCVVQQTVNGTSNVLYGYQNSTFYPICIEFWSEEWSLGVCASLGSDDFIAISSVTIPSAEYFLKIQDESASFTYNLTYLELTSNCPNRHAVRLICMPSTCGQPAQYTSVIPFIVRGDVASEGQWPWAAALQYNGNYICSAALINEEWIVTAAHCIKNVNNGYSLANVPQYFTAVLGTTKRIGFSTHLQIVTFRRIFVHPDFVVVNNVQYNDIALLQMTIPVTIGNFIEPVCLPKGTPPGLNCYAVGWGLTSPDGWNGAPVDLRQAKMEIWPYDTCSSSELWGSRVNNETQLCVGYATGYVTMCEGDSGGPLMCTDFSNRWTLRGVVSTGSNPCVQSAPAKPTLFTNVEYFMPWMSSVIRQNRR